MGEAVAARELAGTWSRGTGCRPDCDWRGARVLHLGRDPVGLAQQETASTLGASVCWDQGDDDRDDDRDHAPRGSDLVDPLKSKGSESAVSCKSAIPGSALVVAMAVERVM